MATAPTITTINPQIAAVAREVAALPDIAVWWDDPAEELSRATIELAWWDTMGYVEAWQREARAGTLPDADARAVAGIMDTLQQHRALARRLGLSIPRFGEVPSGSADQETQ